MRCAVGARGELVPTPVTSQLPPIMPIHRNLGVCAVRTNVRHANTNVRSYERTYGVETSPPGVTNIPLRTRVRACTMIVRSDAERMGNPTDEPPSSGASRQRAYERRT
jgi:hypothetical protein